MDLPKEAWIILFVWNEPEDWVGGYPSELYQQMLTDQYGKAPLHFDTYEDALRTAKHRALYSYIIVPIAGAQAINLKRDNRELTMPSTFPKPIWCEGEFEIYHKHSIYYTVWCKEHLCSYDIVIEPDRHSYIKMNYAIWFDHPWEGMNDAVKKHYATVKE